MNEWQMGLIRSSANPQLLMEELIQAAGTAAPATDLDQI